MKISPATLVEQRSIFGNDVMSHPKLVKKTVNLDHRLEIEPKINES
jgi:hypothetical protein